MGLTGLLATMTLLMPQLATAQFVRHNSIPEVYWGTWVPTSKPTPLDASASSGAATIARSSTRWGFPFFCRSASIG
jgi:hypothetical protein